MRMWFLHYSTSPRAGPWWVVKMTFQQVLLEVMVFKSIEWMHSLMKAMSSREKVFWNAGTSGPNSRCEHEPRNSCLQHRAREPGSFLGSIIGRQDTTSTRNPTQISELISSQWGDCDTVANFLFQSYIRSPTNWCHRSFRWTVWRYLDWALCTKWTIGATRRNTG